MQLLSNLTFISFILAFLFLISSSVRANSIGYWDYNGIAGINMVYETDVIQDKNLLVNMAFSLNVGDSIKNYTNSINISFQPAFFINKPEPVIYNLTVCEGIITGSDPNYNKPPFNCTKNASYSVNKEPSYPIYVINLNVSDIINSKQYVVNIAYLLPNFIFDEGKNNQIAWFNSQCSFPICTQNWFKFITLPSKDSVIQDLSGSINILGKHPNGPWVLEMTGSGQSFVRYYDSSEVDLWLPIKIGVLTGVIVAFLIPFSIIDVAKLIRKLKSKRKTEDFL